MFKTVNRCCCDNNLIQVFVRPNSIVRKKKGQCQASWNVELKGLDLFNWRIAWELSS